MPSTPDYTDSLKISLGNKSFLPDFDLFLGNLRSHNVPIPLWSSTSMFSKDFFQVEVLADREVPMEKSSDDVLNMNTYTCHICDTEVPKIYIKEHNNGEKHKTYLKIADLALERTRKHMRSDTKESRISIQVMETYFCEPCAIVVQQVDKIKHEISEKHITSLKRDEILRLFFMIYEDKDNVDLIARNSHPTEGFDVPETVEINTSNHYTCFELITNTQEIPNLYKILNESQSKSDDNESQTKSDKNKSQSKSDENAPVTESNSEAPKTDNMDNVSSRDEYETLSVMSKRMVEELSGCLTKYFPEKFATKAEKKESIQKANDQLDSYLKTVTEKCNTDPIHSVEALTDKLVLITAINGDQIKVPVNNFHGIHSRKDKSFCKVCEDADIGLRHQHSEEHMEKIMIPIEDKNAIRKIDDIWSHCVLCNDLTRNINFHLQSLLHRNKVKQCLLDRTDINENILHKTNPHKEDTSLLIQQHSLIVSHNNSEITCKICDVTISNKLTSIRNHIKAFDHITNYNATIEKNCLNEIDDQQYYCMPCDVCVQKCYALGHCNGKKHHKQLTDVLSHEDIATQMHSDECESTQIILPSISQQITRHNNTNARSRSLNTESELICFVCNVVLYCVDKHMNSFEHKKNYFSYLEANKLNEVEEDTFYCIPCNTVILIDYLMSHCTGKKHKMLLKNFMSNALNQDSHDTPKTGNYIAENSHICRSITQRVQNAQAVASTSQTPPIVSQNGIYNTAIPLKFLYQFREMSNGRNLLCTVCDEEVPYKEYDVQTHVNLIEHVVAFNLMMLWNKVKRRNDKYFCDFCKVDVTYFNELSHVSGAQHVEVMAKQPKGTVYEYDRMLLTLEHAMSHKVGDRVRPSSIISFTKPKDN